MSWGNLFDWLPEGLASLSSERVLHLLGSSPLAPTFGVKQPQMCEVGGLVVGCNMGSSIREVA